MRLLLLGATSDRALELARAFTAEGHAVRAVTPDEADRARIEATGAECWIGTPDVVGTIRLGFDNVTLVLHLLGDVDDADLHGSRLEMLLERTIDTTVRGIVYETGTTEASAKGRETLVKMATFNEIPHRLVDRDDPDWQATVRAHIDDLLAGNRRLNRAF
jgi:uncharacterized protein YbjT (DUF2867 family)